MTPKENVAARATVCDPVATPPVNFSPCVSLPIVLDAFEQRRDLRSHRLFVTDFDPVGVLPCTLNRVSADSHRAMVRNLCIEDHPENENLIVIEADLDIPVTLHFCDEDGLPGFARSVITLHERLLMFKPQAAKFPFNFEVNIALRDLDGSFDPDDEAFDINVCLYMIFKLQTEALVHLRNISFCTLRDPIQMPNEDCNTFFELPNYPSTMPE